MPEQYASTIAKINVDATGSSKSGMIGLDRTSPRFVNMPDFNESNGTAVMKDFVQWSTGPIAVVVGMSKEADYPRIGTIPGDVLKGPGRKPPSGAPWEV
jgi:hypothetical protein